MASKKTTVNLPMGGTAFIHFALDVIDLVKAAEPLGLDKNGFLMAYLGAVPKDPVVCQAWWTEFRRAVEYSCEHFDKKEVSWAWIRARPGRLRGQFFYHVVAEVDGDRIKMHADPASLARLEPYTTSRWLTQSKSRQRVRAAQGLRMIEHGTRIMDQRLIDRGKDILGEFIMMSPGLAALNFDTGMVTADLQQLSRSTNPHVRLLHTPIKKALNSAKRLERDINQIIESTLILAQIYQNGSQKSLP